jgi:DNA helicase-2/ATP-dependent DNA helicase PcrA
MSLFDDPPGAGPQPGEQAGPGDAIEAPPAALYDDDAAAGADAAADMGDALDAFEAERAELLAGLNPAQYDAVTHPSGPLLVVAGAGSGKTRVLTARIAHLIRVEGVSPFEILAITFTNKAAAEMKQRVAALVGPVAQKMWVSTFHSACVRILRRDGDKLGFPSSFTIYDQADAVRLVSYVLRDLNLDTKRFPPRTVHASISAAKNDGLDAAAYSARAQVIFEKRIADVFTEYQARLLKAGAMDFDDLLLNTVKLFREHPDVLTHYQRRFRHVLVDEYQDTNQVQNEIVVALGSDHRNVCVVGDSDQCLVPGTAVAVPGGQVPVEDLEVGDVVLGVAGSPTAAPGTVTAAPRRHYVGRVYTVTAGGHTLTGTPHHLVPADTSLGPGRFVVYLMYRSDRGYRIGQAMSERTARAGRVEPGVRVRVNQEHADKLWILQVCDSRAEATYWESWFAAEYGLPTMCFHAVGRKMSVSDADIQRLYLELDTSSRAKALIDDLDLHQEFPHHRPHGGGRRQCLNLTMFSDRRGVQGMHRIQWSSNRSDLASLLSDAGFRVRAGKGDSYRVETSRRDYIEALTLAHEIAAAGGMEIRRRMVVGDDQILDVVPLANLRPGMTVMVDDGSGGVQPARVSSVVREEYDGPVHDVEATPTHSYLAGGILVHNSIYAFRGADIRNILEFEDAFPDATVVLLEQNYRSTQTILDAANAVIANNFGRKPKELWTDQGEGARIRRYHADDEADEAQWVAHEIARLHDAGEARWGDVAVFYRTNAQSRVLEDRLMRVGIPYVVIGGTRFYDRREVKDALAYLKAVVNPVDEVSIKRVINVPKRGIGDSTIGKLDAFANSRGIAFIDALRRSDEAGVTGRAVKGIESFLALLDELELLRPQGPAALLEAVLTETGYASELEAEHSVEADGRLENLAELVGVAREAASVDEFLEQVSLVADTDSLADGDDASSVVLMTLHSAKGLEFPAVFLLGMEDGVFPHLRSIGEPDQLEEERRLAYVGITRAREKLYLTNAWCRTLFGSTQYNPPSRFLDEIPEGLIEVEESGRRGRTGGGRRDGSSGWFGSSGSRRDRIAEGRERIVDNAMAPKGPTPHGAESLGLRVGDDVKHNAWGEGVIIHIEGQGDKTEAVVNFPSVGEKRLLLAWAPLEKV